MRDNSYFAQLLNPAMAWTDLGLRALDMTLASAQSMSDGIDRLTRAGAALPTRDAATAAAAPTGTASPTESSLSAAAQLQSSTFELMMRSWEQWMSTMSTLLSLGAGRGMDASMVGQNPWLDAWRKSTESLGVPAGSRDARGDGARRQSSRSERPMEHAFATPESKPRRSRAKPKSRSTRSSGRGTGASR